MNIGISEPLLQTHTHFFFSEVLCSQVDLELLIFLPFHLLVLESVSLTNLDPLSVSLSLAF